MTKDDVKVNVTRIGVILGAVAAFIVILAAFKAYGDGQYVSRDEFSQLKSDVRVIKCSLRPDLCLTTQP